MKIRVDVVDAFTKQRFKGNSAAVVITEAWLADDLMQAIAAENNLSETAFLVQSADGSYHIRWFSPLNEIDFCGHATLAAASVLFKQQPQCNELVMVAEAVGRMTISQTAEGLIEMDFPNRKPAAVADIPQALFDGLSIQPAQVLLNNQAYFAVYDSEADVRAVVADSEQLKKLAPYDVVVTAASEQYDFASRYFWPANGGDEDPVTGSIHTGLAPYWAERLGKQQLHAYQASQRGGELYCRVENDRVFISGGAVHYLQGYIEL
ncbi:PhzF family phenazine biosynthesis protein [Neiella sp. HB171785]|uniref:PhzF family phenazine biosynthesis protein n=1 Tax=Neiella litorisoli TaxID=2771431 RepID=A0A8J6QP11_9GAMM|nr:PhzF family phenazine biosynthesis protein [Neiella litorisoli]